MSLCTYCDAPAVCRIAPDSDPACLQCARRWDPSDDPGDHETAPTECMAFASAFAHAHGLRVTFHDVSDVLPDSPEPLYQIEDPRDVHGGAQGSHGRILYQGTGGDRFHAYAHGFNMATGRNGGAA